jgi:hypothetical protein
LRALTALEHARTISKDIIVFATFSNPKDEQTLQLYWHEMRPDFPLVLRYSPDGGILAPLLDFLHSAEYGIGADEVVAVILPRLIDTRWWHRFLDNHVNRYIERRLSEYKEIKVEVVPVQLDDDDSVLGVAASS